MYLKIIVFQVFLTYINHVLQNDVKPLNFGGFRVKFGKYPYVYRPHDKYLGDTCLLIVGISAVGAQEALCILYLVSFLSFMVL